MNSSFPSIRFNSDRNFTTSKLRWAILAAGITVNAIILFPTLATTQNTADSSENLPSVTYLPPSAVTAQPQTSTDSSSLRSNSDVQKQFALADALAYAGDRDAAVEQYLRAMTAQVNATAADPKN